MVFALLISAAPYTHQGSFTAYQFACAVLRSGYRIRQVFFYQEGVVHANRLLYPAGNELNLCVAWNELANHYPIELAICASSASRFAILDEKEAELHNTASNLAAGFKMSTRLQFLETAIASDRFLSFH